MRSYPIFLVGLENRHCVVIGSRLELENKVGGLIDCGAIVTVISTELTPRLRLYADEGLITWLSRPYAPGDLRGAFLVIAGQADADINRALKSEAEKEGALLNVVDDMSGSDFIAGSVIRQGPLTIAISTSGASPAFAVRLRERFQNQFSPEYAEFLNVMKSVRHPLAECFPRYQDRRKIYYQLVDSDILAHLRSGNRSLAYKRLVEIVGSQVVAEMPSISWADQTKGTVQQ